jgi:hypothetical protein
MTTFSLPELVVAAWLENPLKPLDPQPSLLDEPLRFWRPDFTLAWPGMCYTLEVPPGLAGENNIIHLFLNTSLTFIVFVHDPKFFVYTYNPQAIPMTTWILPKSKTFMSLSLVETERTDLDLPEDPCQPDPAYNFQVRIHLVCLLLLRPPGLPQTQPLNKDWLSPALGLLQPQLPPPLYTAQPVQVTIKMSSLFGKQVSFYIPGNTSLPTSPWRGWKRRRWLRRPGARGRAATGPSAGSGSQPGYSSSRGSTRG